MKNSFSIKLKIAVLYLILFTAVIASGIYIYKEAKKFTVPELHMVNENNKIFLVSSTINDLYNSEAYGRNAILTGNQKDIQTYFAQLDTIVSHISQIQKDVKDPVTYDKLNTVNDLLAKKKKSVAELVKARKAINESGDYKEAFDEIYNLREEIEQNIQPIIIQSRDKQKRSAWARLFKGDNTDTITTTINYPSISDSLISAMEKIVLSTQNKIDQKQKALFQQEQQLLVENKHITDQLRDILQNVEKNIISLSYQKINESKSHISTASTNIAYIGGSALLVIIILGFIIIKDVNQTQEYRVALEKLNKEKEELLRSKTMLFATVTHDLQTPLGGLIGFTDLLNQTSLDDKQNQYVKNIKTSSQYIRNLVNDLTDFSKLENNKLTIQTQPTNLTELIQNTCLLLQPNADNKKIELLWDIYPVLNLNIVTDPYRIKQILTNLISNAIKFTQVGHVKVSALKKEDSISIKVEDTGIGIHKDNVKNIFQEFRQAHDGIEKKFGGTGLGLNISQRLINLLDGTITVDSKLGLGSAFEIVIPYIEAIEGEQSEQTNSSSLKETNILSDLSILVIDDDKIQLQLMEEILSPIFKSVVLKNDPTEVISYLQNNTINLILSDIQMPKMDGFELLNQIQQNNFTKDIPVIALSGKRNLSNEDFTNAGFTGSHPKPLDLNELLKLIAKIFYPNTTFQVSVETPTTTFENEKNNKPYNTNTLKQFIGDDIEALKNLLVIFIESTHENLLDLDYAAEEMDIDTLSNIAHKMLPMFRQLEIKKIIPLLEAIEDKSKAYNTKEALDTDIQNLKQQITFIIDLIQTEHIH
ncbi:ATP-binding protein [Myroides sp. LoEW2-1]|uniref:ATP-binding protein n=1 Tax=Myroides sp. LoEW2-1 TaxID=2683192 RepID=UPI001321A3AD|nr:ATP-binding protein [Myroides sp. LoEW2-1]MVX36548.1 response regulator [Myroides sp. LoEW2-1]